jgi:hypothetical protein
LTTSSDRTCPDRQIFFIGSLGCIKVLVEARVRQLPAQAKRTAQRLVLLCAGLNAIGVAVEVAQVDLTVWPRCFAA